MFQQNNYIVFLSYGNEAIYQECLYALLTLSGLYDDKDPDNFEIWIYTDNPDWFRKFKDCPFHLHYRQTDLATIYKWRGSIDFTHRVKIEALKDFTKDRQGNIFYVDTDVVFTNRIDTLFHQVSTGKLYMHVREGLVSQGGNQVIKKLYRHLRRRPVSLEGQRSISQLAMWNAGVLGFNTNFNHLLDKVLTFTDTEYPKFPKHVVEQFAFSVYFQQESEVKAATHFITHYWNLKEARMLLASFFSRFKGSSWKELSHYSKLIHIPVLMQEKANFYKNRTIAGKLFKRQWLPGKQDWTELLKQI